MSRTIKRIAILVVVVTVPIVIGTLRLYITSTSKERNNGRILIEKIKVKNDISLLFGIYNGIEENSQIGELEYKCDEVEKYIEERGRMHKNGMCSVFVTSISACYESSEYKMGYTQYAVKCNVSYDGEHKNILVLVGYLNGCIVDFIYREEVN